MSELLACPFCGMTPSLKTRGAVTAIVCPDESPCKGSRLMIALPTDDLPDAIAAWNRRAQPSAEPVAMRHLACIEDGELRMMSGYKIPSHDCELYAMPDGKIAPPLYAHPPTDSAALRDAARYQWLREEAQSRWEGELGPVLVHATPWTHTRWREELDSAIDAAIAQQEAT